MSKESPKKKNNDIEELENTFRNLAGKNKPKAGKFAKSGGHLSAAVIIGLCAAVIAIVVGGIFLANAVRNHQVIEANLSIAGVDVTGMTRKDAEKVVSEAFAALYNNNSVSVQVGDLSQKIPASVSCVTLDHKAAVDAAIRQENNGASLQSLDVSEFIDFDIDAVTGILQEFVPHFTSSLIQNSYQVVGNMPEAFDKADDAADVKLEITKGNPGAALDLDALLAAVIAGYSDGIHEVTFECPFTEPEPLDFEAICQEHCVAAIEAEFEPETFHVTGGTYGYAFDHEAAAKALENADYNESISIDFQWNKPEMTAQELEAMLFRDELASYSTHAGSNYDRNINLKLACEAINGVVLYPGDIFSYNETLGERTEEKGYRPGASYVNGETVLDYGGGICQVTSTLYYCTIVADLEIIERECHGYASSYTPLSTDATVFWNGIDFKFKNNTDFPIRIEAYSSYGNVYVSLIGTDTKDYYVKFESVWLETYPFEVVYKEMEEDNPKGFKDGDIITDPYTGYKSEGYRVKYNKETHELIERILESTDEYSSRNKVVCKIKGTATEPPTEPKPTEAPTQAPTEPAPTEPPLTEPEPSASPTEPAQTDPSPEGTPEA